MNIKRAIVQLETRRKAVAKERDKLQDLKSEMDELEECCARAHDDLENAIDALSELV